MTEYTSLFNRKVCCKLFEASSTLKFGDGKERCEHCGYTENEMPHSEEAPPTQNKPNYGKIVFSSDLEGNSKPFDFVTIGDHANPLEIQRFMVQQWQLEPPELIISLIGGGEAARLDPLTKERIKEGITKAVSNAHSWLITSGTNEWLSKVVGEAARQSTYLEWVGKPTNILKCFGINTWGMIDRHEIMEKHVSDYGSDAPFYYRVRQRSAQGQLALDPNHSYFIFVDSGIRGQPDAEWRIRSKLEASFAPNATGKCCAPTVIVLVGGSEHAILNMINIMHAKVPIVVCEGTGGAADLIAFTLRSKSGDSKRLNDNSRSALHDKIVEIWPQAIEREDQIIFALEACLEGEISIWRSTSRIGAEELDAAVLQALLKAYMDIKDPLELCLCWNRVDVAQSYATPELIEGHRAEILMLRAIIDGKEDFIKLLMENGYVMRSFLTRERLQLLYNYAAHSNEVLAWLLNKSLTKKRRKLIQGKNPKMKYDFMDVARLLRLLTGTDHGSDVNAEGTQIDTVGDKKGSTFDFPFVELCIWAVLANRMQLSLFFWSRAKEPIMLALICSKIWQSLASMLWPGEDVFEPVFLANSAEYQDLATGVIDTCYKTDRQLAKLLVRQRSVIWKNKTRMDVSVLANCKNFLATPCVQACVESEWKSCMRITIPQTIYKLINPFSIYNLEILADDVEDAGGNELEDDVDEGFDENCISDKEELMENDANVAFLPNSTQSQNELNVVSFKIADSSKKVDSQVKHSFFFKAKTFYTAPVTKFVTHSVAYLLFLFYFSWMVLHLSDEAHTFYHQTIVFCIALTYAIEELRQLAEEDASIKKKVKEYLKSEWNVIDACYLTFLFSAYACYTLEEYQVGTVLYGTVTMLLWLRVIRLYQAVARLGPLWIMMRKMFVEMLIFITVLVVFLLGYGFCTIALIFDTNTLVEAQFVDILEFVVLIPSLQMFGELFLEVLVQRSNNDDVKFVGSEFQGALTIWLLACYLLIGNVLILNLLIAIFGHIYEEVQENATIEWKNEMFLLCQEYADKPVLPPPFSILESIINLIRSSPDNALSLTSSMVERLRIFESYCSSTYRNERDSEKSLEENVKLLSEHAGEEMDKINDMMSALDTLRQDLDPPDPSKRSGRRKKKPQSSIQPTAEAKSP